jgi:hypothetical protein
MWHVGTIVPGGSATLDVVAIVVNAGRANLTASVTSGPPGDGNAINDSSSVALDARGKGAGSRFVAAGNVNAIGEQEIITGTGTGEPGQVRIFDGQGRALARFYAYDPLFQGGVRVAACDIDGDGRDEIVTGAGHPGGGPHVRIFQAFGERIVEVNSFYSDGEPYRGGIYVACGDVTGDGRPEVIKGRARSGRARSACGTPASSGSRRSPRGRRSTRPKRGSPSATWTPTAATTCWPRADPARRPRCGGSPAPASFLAG